jgi:hypothetical protein
MSETQPYYSHATAIYDGEEFLHAVLWGEHDSGEEIDATHSSQYGYMRGYIRAKWGKNASWQPPAHGSNIFHVYVNDAIVGALRTVVMDMSDPAQAALCDTEPFKERDEAEYAAFFNPNPANDSEDGW